MFTEERIFEIRKVESHEGVTVLYTPFPMTREFIPQELNVYSLLKKINGGFFVGEIPAETDPADFDGTIISAKKFKLGETIDLGKTRLPGPKTNINNYMAENVSKMRIFVIQPMHGKDLSNFDKEMAAIRLLVAKHFNRNIDDIEMIDQLHVDDPYDIDGNFSSERERRIYRLTRSMRMLSTATHAVVFIQGESAPGCDVEITTCRKYKIPMIHIDALLRMWWMPLQQLENSPRFIKEENQMAKITIPDEYENNGVTYGIDKIGEAVERWLAWHNVKHYKKANDPSLYTWNLYDGRLILSLQKLAHGYVISQRNCNYSGTRSNLVKITPPFVVEIIPQAGTSESLERLVSEIKNIPNIQETKQTKRKSKDDFLPKGEAPSILVKNITFNTVKGTTTVVFDDNTKVMTTTTEGEEFNPEIGLAMCIAKKLYGSRANFKRVVKLAMDKSSKGNKKRAEKQKKKAEKAEAVKAHIKAQSESYME